MTGAPVAAATRSAMRGVRAVAWLEAPDPATRESPTATRRRYSDRVAPSRSRAMPERSPSGSGASRTVLAAQAAWASRIVLFTGFTVADPNTRRAPGVRGPLPRRTVEGGAPRPGRSERRHLLPFGARVATGRPGTTERMGTPAHPHQHG